MPTTTSVNIQPDARIQIKGSEFNLIWNECHDNEALGTNVCDIQVLGKRKAHMRLGNCNVKCSNGNGSEIDSVNSN